MFQALRLHLQLRSPPPQSAKAIADYIYGCIHPCCTFPLSDLTGEVPPVRK